MKQFGLLENSSEILKTENKYVFGKVNDLGCKILKDLEFSFDEENEKTNRKIKTIYDLLNLTEGYMAGGVFKSLGLIWEDRIKPENKKYSFGDFRTIKDIDVYFASEEKYKNACKILEENGFIKQYDTENSTGFDTVSDNTSFNSPKIELIKKVFGIPEEIFKDFDFISVKKAVFVKNGELLSVEHEDFFNCLKNKVLKIDENYLENSLKDETRTPEMIFERVYKYLVDYNYQVEDENLNTILNFINYRIGKNIKFEDFKRVITERSFLVGYDYSFSENEEDKISYYSKATKKLIFDSLVELDFQEDLKIVKENKEMLEEIFNITVTTNLNEGGYKFLYTDGGTVHHNIYYGSFISHYILNKLLKTLEKENLTNVSKKKMLTILIVVSNIFGSLKQFEGYYILNLGILKYGESFINFIADTLFKSHEATIPPFNDWIYMIKNDLFDFEILPSILLGINLGISGTLIKNPEYYVFKNSYSEDYCGEDAVELLVS